MNVYSINDIYYKYIFNEKEKVGERIFIFF